MNQHSSDQPGSSGPSTEPDLASRPESPAELRARSIQTLLTVMTDRLRTEGEQSVILSLRSWRNVSQACIQCNQEAKDELDVCIRAVASRLGLVVPGLPSANPPLEDAAAKGPRPREDTGHRTEQS